MKLEIPKKTVLLIPDFELPNLCFVFFFSINTSDYVSSDVPPFYSDPKTFPFNLARDITIISYLPTHLKFKGKIV